MSKPKHPEVAVELVGHDGNAFAILGRCTLAARRAKVSQEEIKQFTEEATSGDYDNLLQTCIKWFDVL